MQKTIRLLLTLLGAAALAAGCAAQAEQHTGEAQGYGGPLRVSVTMDGADITEVRVISHSETQGVGTRAIDTLPALIAERDSVAVDSVSGATVTSEAIRTAVAKAVGLTMSAPEATMPAQETAAPLRTGMGMAATGRLGPGTDENGEPVYSFNVVFACAGFDGEGRVTSLDVDQLEVLSSQFSFPSENLTGEEYLQQVSAWRTKGGKGDSYMLGSGSWRQQMDAYEEMMTGKTMEEINQWYSQHFSEETGKPLSAGEESQTTATEAVTGATMSLRDEHGDILTAIQRAWENAQSTPDSAGETTPPMINTPMIDTNTQTDVTEGENAMG